MPGYSGGVGADTDGPNADYGEGMGTKGAAAADHSIGAGAGAGEAELGGIAAFRSAIAKALGVQDLSGGVGTIASPQAQPGSPALEAHDMDTDAVREALDKAGMNVDPNIIGQAIRAAHEQTTQGPLGAGGTSVGSRNDSFIENFLANIPASSYDEPWMKDLNERQIQYYLDRPSELEWVRNLYNQMNPDSMMTR